MRIRASYKCAQRLACVSLIWRRRLAKSTVDSLSQRSGRRVVHSGVDKRAERLFPLPVVPDGMSSAFAAQLVPSCRFADEDEGDQQDAD